VTLWLRMLVVLEGGEVSFHLKSFNQSIITAPCIPHTAYRMPHTIENRGQSATNH
jgi:hypothetical protein